MSENSSSTVASHLRLSEPKLAVVVDGLQECAAVEALLQYAISCARRQDYHDASDALDVVRELMGPKNNR